MSDEFLIRFCSPTLAGMKTGSLFMYRLSEGEDIRKTIRELNLRFRNKGLRVIPLQLFNRRALIYIYRPERLKTDLTEFEASIILEQFGYTPAKPDSCVQKLIQRLKDNGEFPHEIGLFLGYPPEDVAGFIANNARESKLVGTWKVYGDAEKAERTFRKFTKCTDIYMKLWAQGRTVEKLTVGSPA